MVVSLWDKFAEPKFRFLETYFFYCFRPIRAGVFVCMGLSAIIPAIHLLIVDGLSFMVYKVVIHKFLWENAAMLTNFVRENQIWSFDESQNWKSSTTPLLNSSIFRRVLAGCFWWVVCTSVEPEYMRLECQNGGSLESVTFGWAAVVFSLFYLIPVSISSAFSHFRRHCSLRSFPRCYPDGNAEIDGRKLFGAITRAVSATASLISINLDLTLLVSCGDACNWVRQKIGRNHVI